MYDMLIRKRALKIQERLGFRLGIPYGTKRLPVVRNREEVLQVLKELYRVGLRAFVLPKELFSGIQTTSDLYKTVYGDLIKIKDEAKKLNIELSIHYPDLPEMPDEQLKLFCTIASIMDCRLFILQPNFYRRMPLDQALRLTVYKLNEIVTELRLKLTIGIEVTGRTDELGDLDDVLEIVKRTNSTEPVINWAHLHARGAGGLKRQEDFRRVFEKIKRELGPACLKDIYFFFSGIKYGLKGEIEHIPYRKSDLKLDLLIRESMAQGARGTLIFEDPDREQFFLSILEELGEMVR
ncbi:MAG: hypothetical protein DRP12_00605 [Candidatus Aenigmatarchaeota archaeon]|nr:MAG: hypothetical protein DRP12_00605 [Candidatus Aenigmarchaeota archaeon]